MKASFSSVIMDFIKFWTFTTSQCLSAKQYFPMPDEKEQQEHLSKFNPLLALGVRILMAHTLPCFFLYGFILLCVTILSFDAMLFMHKFQHLSKQGITLFLFQKTEKKTCEVIQLWPQSGADLNFLNPIPGVHCISSRKI